MKYIILIIISIISNYSLAQLSGTRTIGGNSPDYPTITAAVQDLVGQGVNGPLTFLLRNGTYDEAVSIGNIPGASSTNTVTFQSESNDSSAVIWTNSVYSSQGSYTLQLDSASYVIIKKIKLDRSSTSSGSVVYLVHNSTHNQFVSCIFQGNTYSGNTSSGSLIWGDNSYNNYNSFILNKFIDGGYGIYFSGGSDTTKIDHINISNCIFNNQINYAINLYFVKNIFITKNEITSSFSTLNGYFQITLSNLEDSIQIQQNLITAYKGGALSLNNCISLSSSSWVRNNIMTSVTNVVLKISNTQGVQVSNNTMNKRAAYLATNYSTVLINSNGFAGFFNNIVINSDHYYALVTFQNYGFSNNCYYSNGASGNLIKYGYSQSFGNLQDWQNYSGTDQNSIEFLPYFQTVFDYHIKGDIRLKSKGLASDNPVDFDGDPRYVSAPDIGADEFDLGPYEASLKINESIDTVYCQGTVVPLIASLINGGTNNLDTINIHFQINNRPAQSYTWTGLLNTRDTAQNIIIHDLLIEQDSIYQINVWIDTISGVLDTITIDNNATYPTIYSRMAGSYTVGSSTSYFPTIEECTASLSARGICDSVTIDLLSNTYTGSFIISEIYGVSDTSIVTFQSKALNRDSVIIHCSNNILGTQDKNKLYIKSDHIVLNELTIERLLTGSYAWDRHVIEIKNADNVIIQNCNIIGDGNSLMNGNSIRFDHSNNGIIKNNQLERGHYGIIVIKSNNIVVDSNNLNFLYNGISLSQDSGNILLRNNNLFYNYLVDNTAKGIILSGNEANITVYNNHISGGYNTMFTVLENNNNGSFVFDIYNNMFSSEYKTSNYNGNIFVFFQNNDGINLYNNNFNVKVSRTDGNTFSAWGLSTYHGLIRSSNNSNMFIRNNIFKADDVHYLATHANVQVEQGLTYLNNDFWLSGSSLIKYYQDMNNIEDSAYYLDPFFVNFNDLHIQNYKLAGRGLNLGLSNDIDGDIRPSSPTIGADEYQFYENDIAIETTSYEVFTCDSLKVKLFYENICLDTCFICEIQWTINDSLMPSIQISDSLILRDTGTVIKYFGNLVKDSSYTLKFWVSSFNGLPDGNHLNDTVEFNITVFDNSFDLGDTIQFCEGDTVQISVQQVYTNYLWSTNDTTYSIKTNNSGLYSLETIDNYGCIYTDSVYVEKLNPDIPFLSYFNDSIIASTNNTGTFYWYFDSVLVQVTPNNFFIPLFEGNYFVEFLASYGCSGISNTIQIPYPSLVNEIENSNNVVFNLYPNPTNDNVYINFSNLNYPVVIEIYDLIGNLVLSHEMNSNFIKLNTIESGSYYFIIRSSIDKHIVGIKKLIKSS